LHVTHTCQSKNFFFIFFEDQLRKELKLKHHEVINQWSFKYFLKFSHIGSCRQFLRDMFLYFDCENVGFVYNDVLLNIVDEDFSLVLGLRVRGEIVTERKNWRSTDLHGSFLCQKFFS
jgi:hypothetical protein